MMSDKAGNIKDWSNNELRGGCVKIEITYHFVIPSVAEGSQDWLSEMFRLRSATNDELAICHHRMGFPQEMGTRNDRMITRWRN